MDNNNAGLLSDEDFSPKGEVAQKQETKTVVQADPHSATHTDDDAPPTEFNDKPYERVDWEKRYGDMRRYHDKVLSTKEQEIKSLMEQVNSGKQWEVPKTAEEVEKLRELDPKLYEAIEIGTNLRYDTKVEELKRNNLRLKKEAELAKLKMVHPDVDQIKSSKEFKDWIQGQPEEIQGWLFKKLDSALAAKAIDMFKREITVNTSDNQDNKSDNNAADAIKTKQSIETNSNEEHVFTRKEIDRMPPSAFEKYKDVIESQWRRGLIK